jgi:hypothetical protein
MIVECTPLTLHIVEIDVSNAQVEVGNLRECGGGEHHAKTRILTLAIDRHDDALAVLAVRDVDLSEAPIFFEEGRGDGSSQGGVGEGGPAKGGPLCRVEVGGDAVRLRSDAVGTVVNGE